MAFILLLVLLTLTGCGHPVNARLELGALSRTPTFTNSDGFGTAAGTAPRSRWNTTVIIAPVDGIAHGPTLRLSLAPRKTDHPRTYGLLPTADSALDHQTHSRIASFHYTRSELVATLASITDPFRIYSAISIRHWSPRRVWKRTRQDNAWSSGRAANTLEDNDHD